MDQLALVNPVVVKGDIPVNIVLDVFQLLLQVVLVYLQFLLLQLWVYCLYALLGIYFQQVQLPVFYFSSLLLPFSYFFIFLPNLVGGT